MKGRIETTLVCGFLFVLAGCTGVPEIPYDRSAAQVHTIGVPTPAFATEPTIVLASDIGQSFGLVGALVDAGLQARRDKEFQASTAEERFNAPEEFRADLTAALQKDGYIVVPVPVERSKIDLLSGLPSSPQPVDAYLDVAVYGYGYIAAGIGNDTPYRPYLTLRCKLLRASDGAVLMQDGVMLNNPAPNNIKGVSLAPFPEYLFETSSTLAGEPHRAIEGLRKSLAQVASTVASLIQ